MAVSLNISHMNGVIHSSLTHKTIPNKANSADAKNRTVELAALTKTLSLINRIFYENKNNKLGANIWEIKNNKE